jgi:uncharacterized protein
MPDQLAGRLIGQARRSAGLTQKALAERSGETQSVISAYERGRRQPSASAMNRLIEAAGFRLIVVPAPRPAPEPRHSADQLAQALDLTGALPTGKRSPKLVFPRLPS